MSNPMLETRQDLGLSQEQLAKRLGCSVYTVSRHERQPHRTTAHWVLALKQLRVLEVTNGD